MNMLLKKASQDIDYASLALREAAAMGDNVEALILNKLIRRVSELRLDIDYLISARIADGKQKEVQP